MSDDLLTSEKLLLRIFREPMSDAVLEQLLDEYHAWYQRCILAGYEELVEDLPGPKHLHKKASAGIGS